MGQASMVPYIEGVNLALIAVKKCRYTIYFTMPDNLSHVRSRVYKINIFTLT